MHSQVHLKLWHYFLGGESIWIPPESGTILLPKPEKSFSFLFYYHLYIPRGAASLKGYVRLYNDQSVTTCEIMGYYFFYRKSSHNAHVRRKKLWSELRCLKLLVKFFLLADTNCKDKVILIRLYVRSHCILWYGSVCSFTLPWTIYLGLSFLSSKISHLFLQNAQGQASQDNQKDSWF